MTAVVKRRSPTKRSPGKLVVANHHPPPETFEQALFRVRTERSRTFVRAFVATWPQLDATRAAKVAGCGSAAFVTGHRWRRRADIAHAVEVWIRERMRAVSNIPEPDQVEAQAEAILRQAWLQAKANMLWFSRIAEDGQSLVTDFTRCTEDQLSIIESYDVQERVTEDEDGATVTVRRIKLRLKDSARALELLSRAYGLAGEWPAGARGLWPEETAKTPASSGPPHTVNIQVVYETRDRRIAELDLVTDESEAGAVKAIPQSPALLTE
jgi:hypothetical protein